jgi:hypothetical protein
MPPRLNDNDFVELALFHREKADESGIPPVSQGMLLQEGVLEVEANNEKEKKGTAGKQTASLEERVSTVASSITSSLATLMPRLCNKTAASPKIPTSSPKTQVGKEMTVRASSHRHLLFLGKERSEQSTARMIVHDREKFRKLQKQMRKSGMNTNQGARQILSPLLEKRNKRRNKVRVPHIITLHEKFEKRSCIGGADSQTGKTTDDEEMILANELIDWYIDFPTASGRGRHYEGDASDISEEFKDDGPYSYLWSYDD